MRLLQLARIAAEAEALRLRRIARGCASRAARAALAVPFLIGTLGFLEAALWLVLAARLPGWQAALAAAGVNLVLGLLLALPVLRAPPVDPVARDAAELRDQAVAGLRERVRLSAAVVDLIGALTAWLRRAPE